MRCVECDPLHRFPVGKAALQFMGGRGQRLSLRHCLVVETRFMFKNVDPGVTNDATNRFQVLSKRNV